MTTYQTTSQDVYEKLHQMRMNWSDRRICYFLEDCRKRWNNNFLLRDMPNKVAHYLMQYLIVYEEINTILMSTRTGWDGPVITSFFMQHSTRDANGNPRNRLTLDKWKQLKQLCREEYIPF